MGGWPEPSQSFELTRVPRPSFAWAGALGARMLPCYWKDPCLLSAPRSPLRLDFDPLRLLPARVKGSGQECPLYTSQSSGRATNPRIYRIPVNVAELLHKLVLTPYVEIVSVEIMVSSLPERVCCS